MRKYRDYTDQDIIKIALEVRSMAQLLKRLGLRAVGGNYANMKRNLQRLQLDCDHWTGQGWNKDQRLRDWSDYKRADQLKPHLVRMRTNSCEQCNRKKWIGRKITLEIHHVDGDRTNNSIENLKLLCPNCHSLTKEWRGRKNKNAS